MDVTLDLTVVGANCINSPLGSITLTASGGHSTLLDGTFEDLGTTLDGFYSEGWAVGDFTGDGKADMFVADLNPFFDNNDNTYWQSYLWKSTGTGSFTKQTITETDEIYSVAAGNVDTDTDLDLFIGNNYEQVPFLRINNGSGSLTQGHIFDVVAGSGGGPSHNDPVSTDFAQFVDWDNDGDLDLLRSGNNNWYINLNNGSGTYGSRTTVLSATGLSKTTVAGKLVGDAKADLAFASGSTIYVYQGNGTATATLSATLSNGSSVNRLALADIDSDGDLDILVASSGANKVWRNNGNSTFTSTGASIGSGTNSIAKGDIDDDGDIDLYLIGSTYAAYMNNGTGTFTLKSQTISGTANEGALADIDGDGDLDLVTKTTEQIRVYYQKTVGPEYAYHWSSGQSTAALSNLSPNTYRVTVTDGAGCSTTATALVVNGANTTTVAHCRDVMVELPSGTSASITVDGGGQ